MTEPRMIKAEVALAIAVAVEFEDDGETSLQDQAIDAATWEVGSKGDIFEIYEVEYADPAVRAEVEQAARGETS